MPNMCAICAPPSFHITHTFAIHHDYTARDADTSSIMRVDTTDDKPTIRPPNLGSSCGGGAIVEDTASVSVVSQANEAREGQGESEFQCKSIERRAVDSPLGMEGEGGNVIPELWMQHRVCEVSEDIGMIFLGTYTTVGFAPSTQLFAKYSRLLLLSNSIWVPISVLWIRNC